MLFAIFISVICIEVILSLKFSKMARLSVKLANDLGVEVFGRKYRSVSELYMDFNFLNDLFDGSAIATVQDDELAKNLTIMRKLLIGQVVGGLIFFLFGIALGLQG